jgi:hypothetical protein
MDPSCPSGEPPWEVTMKHDKSRQDLERNQDMNMPGSSGSQSDRDVRSDDLESTERGSSSSRSGSQSSPDSRSNLGSSSSGSE